MYTDALWYLSRGTGVVALVLFSVVLALGIVNRSGREFLGLPRFGVTAVHRNASVFALVLLAIHVGGLLFDPYAQLKLVDVVIPFVGSYHAFWLGLGTLAFDLVIALIVTSLLRHRIGRRGFKLVHWTAYAMWPFAALHALGTGTDAGRLWLRVLVFLSAALVVAAVIWRLTPAFAEYTRRRTRVPTVAPPGPPTTPMPVPEARVPAPPPAPAPPPVRRTPGPVAPPPSYGGPATSVPAKAPLAQGTARVPPANAQPVTSRNGQPNAPWNGPTNGQRRDPWRGQQNGQRPGHPEGWR